MQVIVSHYKLNLLNSPTLFKAKIKVTAGTSTDGPQRKEGDLLTKLRHGLVHVSMVMQR